MSSPVLPDSKRASPEPSKHRTSTLQFPPCVICNGKASGLHYGCNTCEACKNFFRRYLIRKNGYICPKKNDCNISTNNKSNCSACRLEKCLHFGMSKTKSKLGRYSYSRRTETIKKVKQLEGKEESMFSVHDSQSSTSNESASTSTEASPNSEVYDNLTETNYDENLVQQLTQDVNDIRVYSKDMEDIEVRNRTFKEHYDKYMAKVNMFGPMSAVSQEEYHTLLKDYGIDIDGQFEACVRISGYWEDVINRYCDFAKKVPGFTLLSYPDQANLLKATHVFAFTILMHRFYSPEYDVFIEANGEAFHVEEFSDKFISRAYMKVCVKYLKYLQKLELTKEEMALLLTISTFFSDVCKLQNPGLVDEIQMKFVELLSQHLNKKLGKREASSRFAKLLDSLTRMRDVSTIYHQEMKALTQDDLVNNAIPLISMLVPDDD